MIIIPIKEGESIERPLKDLKESLKKLRVLDKLEPERYFTKKSEKRREEVLRASYNQRKITLEEQS